MRFANGFYSLRTDQSLGEKIDLDVKKAELVSRDNLNTRFYLSVATPFEKEERPTLVLLIDNLRLPCTSWGVSEGKEKTYGFNVSGKDSRRVADYFKIRPEVRTHPGHRIATTFQTLREEYSLSEDIRVKLTIWNLGDSPLALMVGGRNRGARDNQFSFNLSKNGTDTMPDVGDPIHFGGLAYRVVLKPNDKFEKEVELSKWFKVDREGSYVGLGSYFFEVVPAEGTYRVLWEDYATGEFHFLIKKAK